NGYAAQKASAAPSVFARRRSVQCAPTHSLTSAAPTREKSNPVSHSPSDPGTRPSATPTALIVSINDRHSGDCTSCALGPLPTPGSSKPAGTGNKNIGAEVPPCSRHSTSSSEDEITYWNSESGSPWLTPQSARTT